MTDFDPARDPAPDPELNAALRAALPEPPLAEVDWAALRSTIQARAEMPLARRRTAAQRRRRLRWTGPVASAALAAGIVLTFVLQGGTESGIAADALDLLTVERTLDADVSEREFRMLVAGYDDPEELLLIAIGDR